MEDKKVDINPLFVPFKMLACGVISHVLPGGKGKAIPVTGHEGHRVVRRRDSHSLHTICSQMAEVVSLTHTPPFTPRKIPGTHFCWRLSRPQGHRAAGRIRSIEKSNDLIRNRTRDVLPCSIVPQPTTLLLAPFPRTSNYIRYGLVC
jgi:hypothetical protein